jgi:superoxide dismutase, Cu-Zn family
MLRPFHFDRTAQIKHRAGNGNFRESLSSAAPNWQGGADGSITGDLRMTVRPSILLAGAALALALALGGCAASTQTGSTTFAQAQLARGDGAVMGTASIVAGPRGRATLLVSVAGLTPGDHGIHLHTTGKCEGPDFSSAGGHLNPTGREHGLRNPQGSHLGDMPNLSAVANGTATLSLDLGMSWRALRDQLFDADGTALVIHAGPDDQVTDPSGNSGGRVSCGVFAPA